MNNSWQYTPLVCYSQFYRQNSRVCEIPSVENFYSLLLFTLLLFCQVHKNMKYKNS